MELITIKAPQDWNKEIEALPGAHALQTWQWGAVKSLFGWQPYHLVWRNDLGQTSAAALVLERVIRPGGVNIGLSVMYVPRGPLVDWSDKDLANQVLDDLQKFTIKRGVIFIKIDPDLPVGFGIPGEDNEDSNSAGEDIRHSLEKRGWVFSDEQIQFKNTVLVDLSEDEKEILRCMKSKTRYNIRLAKRRGVKVRTGGLDDMDLLYNMYAHTAVRDDFLIRSKDYYLVLWEKFFRAGLAEPLIAEVDGSPVGAVVIFRFGNRAWYIHGMSLDDHREKMFNYRLQWEAMIRSKAVGCKEYDMWGAPDAFNEDDPLWGVYRFKDGFGGKVVRTIGAWDYPVRSILYRLYAQVLPRILGWMRRRGKTSTKRSLSA